jgi:CD109 antigen
MARDQNEFEELEKKLRAFYQAERQDIPEVDRNLWARLAPRLAQERRRASVPWYRRLLEPQVLRVATSWATVFVLLVTGLTAWFVSGRFGNGGDGGTVVALSPLVDGYVAMAPRVLRSGQTEGISVALFDGEAPARGDVEVSLLKDGEKVADASSQIKGKGVLSLSVPQGASGQYEIQVQGPGFRETASISVQEGTLVFLETDKPIYKPGQTVMMRVLTLDADLKPVEGQVAVEVMDAKGIKVFKKDVATDDYGMASLEMPLSTEPNLGVWKVSAAAGQSKTQVDVRVEEYVLPKYEVKVDLAKEWALVSEPISGKIQAQYSFGKPVKGEAEIVAKRYVGTWQEYARVTMPVDGQTDFDLPPVGYVTGVPGAGGLGQVTLEVSVREPATGYEEKTTRLIDITSSPVRIQVIPESNVFKPQLPLGLLVISETPGNELLDKTVTLTLRWMDKDLSIINEEKQEVSTSRGKGLIKVTPPSNAAALTIEAAADDSSTSLALRAEYSPTGSFIHIEQISDASMKVGDKASFKVHSTKETVNYYYEVVARGKVVFSDFTQSSDIAFTVTPQMAPSARLLVYQLLPNSEVAADYLPFNVEAGYPLQVETSFGKEEVKPSEEVDINVQADGRAKVALVAVDRSVFILAENRLNLQQVFDELERLYLLPQVELHDIRDFYEVGVKARGAEDTIKEAGLLVLSNKTVPASQEYEGNRFFGDVMMPMAADGVAEDSARAASSAPPAEKDASLAAASDLAEVGLVRQFFPETWLWTDVTTNSNGEATLSVKAPDSITTWSLRAVALSKEHGLGVSEAQLRVFQPLFLQPDLPFSLIRGEEVPLKISLYNYLDQPQEIVVELEEANGFDILDETLKTVTVAPQEVGGVQFKVRPTDLGVRAIRVTARSKEAADAVVKEVIVEAEGLEKEDVENLVLSPGAVHQLETHVPNGVVSGSARAYISVTGSYLTQTMEGLDQLLKMPFGCGEQNMLLMAPNTFVLQYLKATNQLKPEVMAKAEKLMITGYQRQLTYRRADGSFSAFGDSDEEGSLWLTAFVLKTFAQAKDLIFIDDAVQNASRDWIVKHQLSDGSFEQVGFVHHQELLGGLQGKDALTAFVAISLREAGEESASGKAVRYLEQQLDSMDDTYTLAVTAYAFELAGSPRANDAYQKLMSMAKEDDGALYWGDEPRPLPEPVTGRPGGPIPIDLYPHQSAAIETTAYAALALIGHGDLLNASRASRWLVGQRNAYGGYTSTQDTVIGLQALTTYSTGAQADVDLAVTLRGDFGQKQLTIKKDNFDVLQVVDVPVGQQVEVQVEGKGQAVLQVVRRYNVLPETGGSQKVFDLDVTYSADQVEVNDLITISASVTFNPPKPVQAGMVILDVSVPTGFSAVGDSLDRLVQDSSKVKRFEVSGRKVILYIEDMAPGEKLSFQFQAQALYPVKAKAVTSQAYSYYTPEWSGESQSVDVVVE